MTLSDLTTSLRALHRSLLLAARDEYEAQFGKVRGAYALLHLASTHPVFAFLHPLSEFMVDLEVLLEEKEEGEQEPAQPVADELRELLRGSEEHAPFAARYRELLQRDPEVVIAHAKVLEVLRALPVQVEEAGRLHDKHRWAMLRRHRYPESASAATIGGAAPGGGTGAVEPRRWPLDEVDEASRQSFPASDPPGWIDHDEP